MRVLLVGPDLESNLSLRYLASSLRAAGHEARIATFDTPADAAAVVAAAKGNELVGLSMCFQVRAPEFLALARALKAEEPARPVLAGGHYASCAAVELLERHPELDLIVVHEGEQAIVELANLGPRLLEQAGALNGVAVRRGGRPELSPARPILDDLDLLPPPDRSGPARLVAGVPTAYLMGSRGCVSSCDYCCITTLHRLAPGRRFRQRTPEHVGAEMADLYHRAGVRQFVFHDDNFLVPSWEHNRDRVDRLGQSLEGHGVKEIGLVLKCSPRDAERRIFERLGDLGLIRIFMGIESGTQCGLDAIGRKQTVAQAEAALELCEALDLSSQYTLIIFHPEATPDSMLADLEFAKRHPAHPLNYCRAEVYAGTPLEKRLLDQGRALGDYLGRHYRYTDPRVEKIWEVGSELFSGRCWGRDELLGQAIRLDHQVTVVRHFYEGRDVQRLWRRFRALQEDLNLGTAALFTELVQLCADPALDAAGLARARADLERRERKTRDVLTRRLCEVRADIEQCTRVALPVAWRPPPAPRRRTLRFVAPRHAAAVAVALGFASLPGAADEKAPHQVGVADAGVAKVKVAPPFRPDVGVAEAAPPPYDRYRIDHGVAEAAPPPYDRYRDRLDLEEVRPAVPAGWTGLSVTASPELTVFLSGVGRVSGAVTLPTQAPVLTVTVNGSTAERLFEFSVKRQVVGNQQVVIAIESEPPLEVLIDGVKVAGGKGKSIAKAPGRRVVHVVDPATKAWVQLSVTAGP